MKMPSYKEIKFIIYDFDGVFTDNSVYVDSNSNEFVRCNRGDGLGLNLLNSFLRYKKLDIDQFILSTEVNPVVQSRADKLGLQCYQGISNKLEFVVNNLSFGQEDKISTLFLCNDLNDLELMRYAGHSVVPSDAHNLVKQEASVVLESKGGDGFLREFVEEFINIQSMSNDELFKLLYHNY